MAEEFDKQYWERHWQEAGGADDGPPPPPNPHLAEQVTGLVPGTALDAGCGTGAEAVWLAAHGWRVTAVDVSSRALARAERLGSSTGVGDRVRWVKADLTAWEPDAQYDLVVTHYAHPAMPQLELYERLAGWVAPGGTLLVVGHLAAAGTGGHGHEPPQEASVTAATVAARLAPADWDVVTAEERTRTGGDGRGHGHTVHDVVVRATRRSRGPDRARA